MVMYKYSVCIHLDNGEEDIRKLRDTDLYKENDRFAQALSELEEPWITFDVECIAGFFWLASVLGDMLEKGLLVTIQQIY